MPAHSSLESRLTAGETPSIAQKEQLEANLYGRMSKIHRSSIFSKFDKDEQSYHLGALHQEQIPANINRSLPVFGSRNDLKIAACGDATAIVSRQADHTNPKFELAHVVSANEDLALSTANRSSIYILCSSALANPKITDSEISSIATALASIVEHRIKMGTEKESGPYAIGESPVHANLLVDINDGGYQFTKSHMKALDYNQPDSLYMRTNAFIESEQPNAQIISKMIHSINQLRFLPSGMPTLLLDYIIRASISQTAKAPHKCLKALCIVQALQNAPTVLTKSSHKELMNVLQLGLANGDVKAAAKLLNGNPELFEQVAKEFVRGGLQPKHDLKLSITCLSSIVSPIDGFAKVEQHVAKHSTASPYVYLKDEQKLVAGAA